MKQEISCGTIVIKDSKVLIVRQLDGYYGFPKGHMEDGETYIDTAIRETKEETGLDVIIDSKKVYKTNYIINNEINKTVIFFKAIPKNNRIVMQKDELMDIGFFSYSEALKLLSFDNIKELFKEFLKDIE